MEVEFPRIEKWFARSRRLWSAALPLLVAIGATFDLDPAELSGLLGAFGEAAGRVVTAVVSLAGAAMALWSFLRPDHARLRAAPKGGGGGGVAGAGLFAGLVVLVACASTPAARYAQASELWLAANRAYNAELLADNTQYAACRRTRPESECHRRIDVETRQTALALVERANRLLDALAPQPAGEPPDPARAARSRRALEAIALELTALIPEEDSP